MVLGATIACWGTVVVVWIAFGIRGAPDRHGERIRGATELRTVVAAIVAVAAIIVVGDWAMATFTLGGPVLRVAGCIVLVASTAFAVWARVTLGGSWSVGPRAATDLGLRTDGPYAITRHPIYTGLLGMLLGTGMMGGLVSALVLVAAGGVFAWLKIRAEERLLLATFPAAYRAYSERVPQVIPGLNLLTARRR